LNINGLLYINFIIKWKNFIATKFPQSLPLLEEEEEEVLEEEISVIEEVSEDEEIWVIEEVSEDEEIWVIEEASEDEELSVIEEVEDLIQAQMNQMIGFLSIPPWAQQIPLGRRLDSAKKDGIALIPIANLFIQVGGMLTNNSKCYKCQYFSPTSNSLISNSPTSNNFSLTNNHTFNQESSSRCHSPCSSPCSNPCINPCSSPWCNKCNYRCNSRCRFRISKRLTPLIRNSKRRMNLNLSSMLTNRVASHD